MTTSVAGQPIVAVRGIRKSFPGVIALDDVDLVLRPGEVHALAGENGSGKSTLAKLLYGGLRPDSGVIEVDGKPLSHLTPSAALRCGIVAISQELTLAPTLSIAENILMGRLPRRAGAVDWAETRIAARRALKPLGVELDETRRVDTLSIELQQEVEVARAISRDMRVLILDEATSSLSEAATERLLEVIEQLRRKGVAILFISHRLRELYRCASIASVLRDGKLVAGVSLSETSESELVSKMVGREVSTLFQERSRPVGGVALEVSRLSTKDGSVQDVSFSLRRGEIVGIAGLVGCGKTELGLALAGDLSADGEIRVRGEHVRLRSPRHAIEAGLAYVPEDRKKSALFRTRSVKENFSVAWLRELSRFGLMRLSAERTRALVIAQRFRVRTSSLDVPISQLSGGNQQKVVLGRWFSLQPAVMVLGEPTRGIDVGAKSEVYASIHELAENGTGVLLISSELTELLGLADRIFVMHRGTITAEFNAKKTTEEEITHAAFGASSLVEAEAS
jgi:ABC-type sugar transport system ATPase subunit